jgi:hypothetical protein
MESGGRTLRRVLEQSFYDLVFEEIGSASPCLQTVSRWAKLFILKRTLFDFL